MTEEIKKWEVRIYGVGQGDKPEVQTYTTEAIARARGMFEAASIPAGKPPRYNYVEVVEIVTTEEVLNKYTRAMVERQLEQPRAGWADPAPMPPEAPPEPKTATSALDDEIPF